MPNLEGTERVKEDQGGLRGSCTYRRASRGRGRGRGQRTVALHDLQELDNDLGRGPDQGLALAGLLGVVDGVESIVENGGADHLGGSSSERRFSNRQEEEVRYLPACRSVLR